MAGNDTENSNQDPFEEFEFKPLTEGLGFHKKAEQIKSSIQNTKLGDLHSSRMIPDRPPVTSSDFQSSTPASDSISKLMSNLPPIGGTNLDFVEETPSRISTHTKEFATELNRPKPMATPTSNQHGFRQSEFQARLEESFAKAFPSSTLQKTKATKTSPLKAHVNQLQNTELELVPVAGSVSSAVVDALTVVGISILCLVVILGITGADLFGLLHNASTDELTQFHLVLLFVSTLQLYMLIARSFFARTLGEWAFDTQLGTAAEQARPIYPVQVVWRTLLATATLFVVPLLSFFTGRDLLQPLTGLQLFGRASHDQKNI